MWRILLLCSCCFMVCGSVVVEDVLECENPVEHISWTTFHTMQQLGKKPFVVRDVPSRNVKMIMSTKMIMNWDAWQKRTSASKDDDNNNNVAYYPYWTPRTILEPAATALANWEPRRNRVWENITFTASLSAALAKCDELPTVTYAMGKQISPGYPIAQQIPSSLFSKTSIEVWFLSCAGIVSPQRVGAKSHFDEMDNLFFQLKSRKRIVLSSPSTTIWHYIAPTGHPEHRQSQLFPPSLSNISSSTFPYYDNHERFVIELDPGDLLFIPAFWMHHITSMDTSGATLSLGLRSENEQDPIALFRALPLPFDKDWSLDKTTRYVAALLIGLFDHDKRKCSLFASRWRLAFAAPQDFDITPVISRHNVNVMMEAQLHSQTLIDQIKAICIPFGDVCEVLLFAYADDVILTMFVETFSDREAIRFGSTPVC